MSEHRRTLSHVNEEEIEFFFETFCNWEMIDSNSDIKGGGIDVIYKYFNVYSNRYELVLVESKRIKGNYIGQKKLEKQVYKIKNQIEKYREKPNSIPFVIDSVEDLIGYLNKGIIVHRHENFDLKIFKSLMENFPIKERRNTQIILLNNYYISRLAELYTFCREKNCIYWFYPSYDENFSAQFYKNPTPNHLISGVGFILNKENYRDDPYYFHEVSKDELIVYCYDEPKLICCEYIASLIKNYQIKEELIREYIFLKGDHYEKKTYFNNLRRTNLNLKKEDKDKLILINVDDKQLNDFKVIFRK